jgi:hypothetical protein
MPLKANSNSSFLANKENRANYSASFVLTTNGQFTLDTCPKCGQNVCEHASLAEVIHLPNSVSQDFSTYSSDSSLIKQLFSGGGGGGDPAANRSTATLESIDLTQLDINDLNKFKFAKLLRLNSHRQLLGRPPAITNVNSAPTAAAHNNESTVSSNSAGRPLSCQVMLIDQETTDRLLKDFYDASKSIMTVDKLERTIVVNETGNKKSGCKQAAICCDAAETTTINNETPAKTNGEDKTSKEKSKKKTKFPNFRLFLKRDNNNNNNSANQTPTHTGHHHRHHLLVNCLTSSGSSSSSSCEDVNSTKFNTIKKAAAATTTNTTNNNNSTTTAPKNKTNNSDNESTPRSNATKTSTLTSENNINPSTAAPTILRHDTRHSIMSINSKTIDDDVDNLAGYNEVHTLELCPIVGPNDIDEDYYAYEQIASILNQQQQQKQLQNQAAGGVVAPPLPLDRKNILLLTTTCRKENTFMMMRPSSGNNRDNTG